MQNGMITTQPTPHHGLCFVPTSKILIPASKSGRTRRRLVGRQEAPTTVTTCTYTDVDTHIKMQLSHRSWKTGFVSFGTKLVQLPGTGPTTNSR